MIHIKKGDLIKIARRKRPGVGIILKQIDDVAAVLEIENPRTVTKEAQLLMWHERAEYIKQFSTRSGKPELTFKFFYYNAKWCKKYKNKLSYVRWFKRPSAFGSTELNECEWYPTDWLKTL